MSNRLWRTTFERLRERFQAAADKHGPLQCVLIEVGPQHWGTDRITQTPRRPPSDKLKLIEGGGGIYRDSGKPEFSSWRRVYYVGKRPAANAFLRLSREASCALENTDIPGLRDIPPETTGSRGLRWMWTVFDLAWQKPAGTALKAEKMLWCGSTTFPYARPADGTPQRTIWEAAYKSGGWGDYPPDCFCSELRDVFAASAYVCDIMLSLTDEQVEAKIDQARNIDRMILTELRESITAYKAYLKTGERCKRRVPNVGDIDCISVGGEDAVEQLQALHRRLAVAVEHAYDVPHLRPTADLLTTARPFWLLGPDAELNFNVPHSAGGSTAKLRPCAEYVRAEMLGILGRALARLQMIERAGEADPSPGNAKVTKAIPNRPAENAFIAWRLRDLRGLKGPTVIAEEMTKQLKRNVSQGSVGRWLKQVGAYLKAGGIFPDLPALTEQPHAIDPTVIDMGERRDQHTPRQRQRRDPGAD